MITQAFHQIRGRTVRLLLAGLCATAFLGAARAQAPEPQGLTAGDQRSVAEVISYLQGLSTATGRFDQTATRGGRTTGVFYLQRPGRARFDYDPPSGLKIASDGRIVTVLDGRLKTMRTYALGSTPLGLFLARDIRLDRGVVVSRVIHDQTGMILVARDAKTSSRGEIALNFSENPLSLTGWSVTDAGGSKVTVRLEHLERSAPKPAPFFELKDPKMARGSGADRG